MGVGGQRHAPSALPPEKTGNPLYRKLGEHQDRSGRVRKISPLPGFEPRRPAFSEPLYLLSYPVPRQAAQVKLKLLIEGSSFSI